MFCKSNIEVLIGGTFESNLLLGLNYPCARGLKVCPGARVPGQGFSVNLAESNSRLCKSSRNNHLCNLRTKPVGID